MFFGIYFLVAHTSLGSTMTNSEGTVNMGLATWEALATWSTIVLATTLLFSPLEYIDARWTFRKKQKIYEKDLIEWRAIEAVKRAKEDLKAAKDKHRDAETQDTPYRYQIGRHGNVTLAIRCGIANYRYARSGQGYEPKEEQDFILVQKVSKVATDKYLAKLPDFSDRLVQVIIEPGTEFVKTFYPLDENKWFQKYGQLEQVIKDNKLYSIAELAKLHVEKTH